MSHNLRDRCSEYLAGPFTATVGASAQLGGAIQRPFVGQTYKTAYGTSTGDEINALPINIDQGVNWQSGYAKFDHDTNSIEIQSISASSAGGAAVAFTAAATVSIVMLADIPFASAYKFRPTGVNDHLLIEEAQADLAAEGGGKLILMQGDWDIQAVIPIRAGIHLAGEGKGLTNLIIPSGLGVFTVFDFDSIIAGVSTDQHHWGISHLTLDGENAANTTQAIVTKSNVNSIKNVTLESVAIIGFGKDDATVVTQDVVALRDPEGLSVHNSDFLDFGNRVGVRVRNKDATEATGASIFTNNFKGIKGTALMLDDVNHSRATFNEFDMPDSTSKGLVLEDSDYNNIALNQYARSSGTALSIEDTSTGNQLLGNVGISDGGTGTKGIVVESTCVNTSILAGSFTGYEDDLDDTSTTTYIASLATTGGDIVHKPEPEPIPDPVVVPPIPPFFSTLSGGTIATTGTRTFTVAADVVRITILAYNLTTVGTDTPRVQLVTDQSGSNVTKTSGYTAISTFFGDNIAVQSGTSDDGFPLYRHGNWSSGVILRGTMVLHKRDSSSDIWIATGQFAAGTDKTILVTGNVDLGGDLTEIDIVSSDNFGVTGTISMIRE